MLVDSALTVMVGSLMTTGSDHLMAHAPHGIVVLSRQDMVDCSGSWRVTQANPVARDLLGWEARDDLARGTTDLLTPAVVAAIDRVAAGEPWVAPPMSVVGQCRSEVVVDGPTGYWFLYPRPASDSRPVRDTSAGLPHWVNDLTDLIVETIPDYFFVKDQHFRLVVVNERFKTLYPESMRAQIVGTTTLEAYDPGEREAFLAMDRKAFDEGYSEVEETITFPDGEVRTLLTVRCALLGTTRTRTSLVWPVILRRTPRRRKPFSSRIANWPSRQQKHTNWRHSLSRQTAPRASSWPA